MKRVIISAIIIFTTLYSYAQTLKVSTPSHVATGENFRLSYVINTQDVGDIHIGNIPEALELITGPYRSSQSSYQVVNGHASSSSSTTYTFILCASKGGSYTIPSATVVVNGHRLSSHPINIKVTGRNIASNKAPRMHDDSDNRSQLRTAGSTIKNSDLFIKVSASKNKIYEQEPVVLTYKVYTLVDLNELKGNMPDLTGFHTLEVPLPQQKSFHIENYNGRPYRCVTWSQYIMYPQMHGQLKVPSIVFKGSVVQQNRNVDPLEAFFNGGSAYVEVKRDIVAPGLTLNVLPLPTKPVGFSGGVGLFNISAQINKKEIRSNEPFTLRVVVSGQGNLKLIKKPTVKFPKDFDKYDPKVTDKTKITANGLEGNMVYDFIAVPRNQGQYTIPPVEFIYFNTRSHSYKTLKTQAFCIDVKKGNGGSSVVSDFGKDMKDEDIRPIMEGDAETQDVDEIFFGSFAYWIAMLFICIVSICIIICLKKYITQGNDSVRVRKKHANRIALKRLRLANNSMLKGNKESFYEDVLKAMWGYVEEKFNMSADKLNRTNIVSVLIANGIDMNIVNKFIGIIDECEMERFSPSSSVDNMDVIFENAMNTITCIENSFKRKTKKGKTVFLVLLFLIFAIPSFGITKSNADTEYKRGNYQQAIKDYNEVLKTGASAEVYYNLGNAYFRTDNITYSILCYERAHMLAPSNGDIEYNLQIAQSRTIDKIIPEPEMFLVKWFKSIVNLLNVNHWAILSLLFLTLTFVLFAIYMFSAKLTLRKISFFCSILSFAFFVIGNICAWQQRMIFYKKTGAIVMASSLQLKKVPDEKSENIAVIHEGTKVEIIDDSMKDWKYVRLGDNREGWLHKSQIEKI